jgi:hypothetical protein
LNVRAEDLPKRPSLISSKGFQQKTALKEKETPEMKKRCLDYHEVDSPIKYNVDFHLQKLNENSLKKML